MRILRRAGGVFECQTKELRLRFKPTPGTQKATLIIHHLKPNGYIRKRLSIEIANLSERAEVGKLFQTFIANAL